MRTSILAFAAGVIVAVTVMIGDEQPIEVRAEAPARPMVAARLAPVALSPATAPAQPPPPPPPPRVERVLIISEDGMRPDALTERTAPHHLALMRQGTTARTCDTIDQSDTLPAHASMLSGFAPRDHGLRWNSLQPSKGYIKVPTIFAIAKQHGLKTALFAGKTKLRHIAKPGTVDHYERPTFLCSGVVKRATAYLAEHEPEVMFVHFADPDEYGHSDGWMTEAYFQGVAQADRCLGKMMEALDDLGLAETTLVIVTADHGGHNRTHSGAKHLAVDRHIPWIARGPGVPADAWIEETVDTVDTAATALAALRLPAAPGMIGVPRLELPAE